ncbi:hypothetical protein PQR11_24170 [Paraburkholderia strydomiana]|uniref:hypothetical protein n=1 Tax=Paraburkholderia strydomiana TaxID=1245417 RepID=UPI0038BA8EC2
MKDDRRKRAASDVRLYQTICRSGTLWVRCRPQHDRVTILGETVSGKLTYPGQDWIVEHVRCPHALVKDRLDEARGDLPGGAADIKQCDHVFAPVPSKQHAFANRRRQPQPGLEIRVFGTAQTDEVGHARLRLRRFFHGI